MSYTYKQNFDEQSSSTSINSKKSQHYKDLYCSFITQPLCDKLKLLVEKLILTNGFFTHRTTHIDGLHFYNIMEDKMIELERIQEDCNFPIKFFISALPPNFTMCIHSDHTHVDASGSLANKNTRYSTISMPILPQEDIAPTHWYNNLEGDMLLDTAYWIVNRPKLLDIKTYHGNIKVGDQWRVNLQFSLPLEYEDAAQKIIDGTLFKTYRCSDVL